MEDCKLKLNVKLKGMEESLEKAERLVELLKEAKTLAEELASVELNVEVK